MELLDHASGVGHLFEPGTPNTPILFAGIEGRLPVRVVVDHPTSPTRAGVRTPEGMTFFSPLADWEFVRDGIRMLQHVGPVMAVVDGDEARFPKPDVTIPRREYRSYSWSPNEMPDSSFFNDFQTVVMTDAWMQNCSWRELIEHSYGAIGLFLDNAFGFCLVDGETILAEAYGAFVGAGRVEIGVFTAENHRRCGYAFKIVSHLLRDIKRRGLEPNWSCDETNAASQALARKLGFQEEAAYSIFGYRPLKVPDLNVE